MRRPLKPFVTEYKGTRRQQSNQAQVFETPRSPGPPQSGSSNFGSSGSVSSGPATQRTGRANDSGGMAGERSRSRNLDTASFSDGDDAYEAAMRAADALFARPGTPPPAATGSRSEPMPPAGASSPPTGPSTPPAETSVASAGPSPGERAPPERSGRILQVIDEAPLPQFAALEAEYAPKRRGRKPGSKNKPKVGKLEVPSLSAIASVAALPLDATGRETSDETSVEAFAPSDATPAVSPRAPSLPAIEAIVAVETAPRGQRRPVRGLDRVKPGEGWKRRRLPRVCW